MKTVFDDRVRNELLSRVERLTNTARPMWGKMNAEQMTAHLTESLRMATGEITPKSKNLPMRFAPLRQLVVYWLPWPKGAPTAPELLPADCGTVERNKAEIARLLGEVGGRGSQKQWPQHPAFGNLGRRGWGALIWRHCDHHLRQFGV
ncbi:MAG TPA: DUF1569 domain-containing protein [Thermoanaerobaculia bacterium]|nr:DUF1569 domain-containing protein [Thermoanaerobaculia bacterium]